MVHFSFPHVSPIKIPVVITALLFLVVIPGRADLVTNGSFEAANTLTGADTSFTGFVRFNTGGEATNTDLTGWTITGSNQTVDLLDGTYWQAYDGTHSLDLEGAVAGNISQTLATTSGQTYALSFEYSNNPAAGGPNAATANVLVGGVLLNTVSHSGIVCPTYPCTVAEMNYQLFSETFTATSSSTALEFDSTSNSGYGIVLDAISVNATPEPTSILLLLTVVGGVAFTLRQRLTA